MEPKDSKSTHDQFRRELYQSAESIFKTVLQQFSPAHHQLESYDKFINTILERIFFEDPIRTVQRGNELFVLEICGYRLIGPMHQEPNGLSHAIYPAEAHLRMLNYDIKPMVTFSYRIYDKTHKDGIISQSSWKLKSEELCEINVGMIPCQKYSKFCRLYESGAMAHEDPNAPNGTFYYFGTEKYFESHTQLRTNYPFVYKRQDDMVAVQCDYHTASEFFHRHTCAIHFYLVDQTAKNQKDDHRNSNQRKSLFETDISGEAHQSQTSSHFARLPCDQYISIALPNIKYFNFTLVSLMFLMGVPNRQSMIDIFHSCCDDPNVQAFVSKMIMTQTIVIGQKTKFRKSDQRHESTNKQNDESIDGWTRDELIDYYAKLIAVKLPMSKTILINGQPTVLNAHQNAVERLRRSFTEELLPNIGVDMSVETMQIKMIAVAHIVIKMVLIHMNLIPADVQDHASMKVINMVGTIMTKNYRIHFMDAMRHMHDHIFKSRDRATPPSLKMILESKFHKNPLSASMGTNNWASIRGGRLMGITQELTSISPATMAESMRTIKTIVDKRSKLKELHQLDGSNQGFICKYHTPADSGIGLKTYMTQTTIVRQGYETSFIINVLFSNLEHYACKPLLLCDMNDLRRGIPIFIHGIVGYSFNPEKTIAALKRDCRLSILAFDIGITWVGGPMYPGGPLLNPYQNWISIRVDVGVNLRPFLVADRIFDSGSIIKSHQNACRNGAIFHALIEHGIIEYLDPETIITKRIADRIDTYLDSIDTTSQLPKFQWTGDIRDYQSWTKAMPQFLRHSHLAKAPYTHIEISDLTSMGWVAALNHFTSHNHSNRNIFNAGMMTQVIGVQPLNSKYKVRGTVNTLLTPTQNASTPSLAAQLSSMDLSAHGGQTRIVAIMCDPYNGEDGTSHVRPDFGFGHHYHKTWVKSMVKIQQSKGKDPTCFQKPDALTFGRKSKSYDQLNDDGRPRLGALIPSGGAVIGKVFRVIKVDPNTGARQSQFRDKSELNRSKQTQRVCEIIEASDSSGKPIIHVALQNVHVPMLGDKMILPHGQKGVVSKFYGREEMPYYIDKDTGIVHGIDMMFNPHGIPSRSTVGPIAEALHERLWRHCHDILKEPWQRYGVATQRSILKTLGMSDTGKHLVYHGETGQPMEAHIFIGTLNVQLLMHKASIKYKSRNMGPKYYKTQQPVPSGHGGNSGNRTGEMETTGFNAHGAMHIMNQALFTASDPSMVFACSQCGMLAEPPKSMHTRINKMIPMEIGAYCRICRSWDHVVCLSMPHISQLIIRENYAQGIAWRLIIEKAKNDLLSNQFNLQQLDVGQVSTFDPEGPVDIQLDTTLDQSQKVPNDILNIDVDQLHAQIIS